MNSRQSGNSRSLSRRPSISPPPPSTTFDVPVTPQESVDILSNRIISGVYYDGQIYHNDTRDLPSSSQAMQGRVTSLR